MSTWNATSKRAKAGNAIRSGRARERLQEAHAPEQRLARQAGAPHEQTEQRGLGKSSSRWTKLRTIAHHTEQDTAPERMREITVRTYGLFSFTLPSSIIIIIVWRLPVQWRTCLMKRQNRGRQGKRNRRGNVSNNRSSQIKDSRGNNVWLFTLACSRYIPAYATLSQLTTNSLRLASHNASSIPLVIYFGQ